MGIIESQSKNNLLILVFAVLFGALNNIVLFPIALNKEEWGIIRFLPTIAIIVSNVALFGVPQILLKYMPSFKKDGKKNNGLLFYCLTISIIGLGVVSIFLILFKTQFLGVYEENASRLNDYFNYLFPLLILTALTELLSAFSRAHLFSVFQLFLREILHRIVQSILLILVLFSVIDFDLFVLLYSFSQLINLVFLVFFMKKEKILDFRHSQIQSKEQVKILKYGGANFLTGLGATLTGRIDSLMITALVSGGVLFASNGGLEAVAIYAFGAYMVNIIEMHARAVSNIANSIVAKAWEENDLDELSMIYRKTSINQIIVGGLLFVLIWAGIDELFELVGNYHEAKWVVFFLGLGKMISISFGSASSMIVSSKYYTFAMYGMIFLAIITFLLNLFFIPIYGIEGAAIATAIALLMYYCLSFLLLKVKSNLQPFTKNTVVIYLLIAFLFIVAHFVDFGLHPVIEIFIMTLLIGVFYVFMVFKLNISKDMNQTILNILKKIRILIARKIIFPVFLKFGIEKIFNRSEKNSILNIMYHGVLEASDGQRIIRNIDASQFEKHILYLKENFEILSLDETLNHLSQNKINLNKRAVTLSFDDGYENNLSVLLPLLEKHNIPATIYVLGHLANESNRISTVWSNYIDVLLEQGKQEELNRILNFKGENVDLHDYYNSVKELSSEGMKNVLFEFESSTIFQECIKKLNEEAFQLLNVDQLKALSKSPLITIGSHAYWHCNIGIQELDSQLLELKKSKEELESCLGIEINSLAYPDGSYTRETLDIAEKLGYTNQWAVKYQFREDNLDKRIMDRHGIASQTSFESNAFFINLAFNKHSL